LEGPAIGDETDVEELGGALDSRDRRRGLIVGGVVLMNGPCPRSKIRNADSDNLSSRVEIIGSECPVLELYSD